MSPSGEPDHPVPPLDGVEQADHLRFTRRWQRLAPWARGVFAIIPILLLAGLAGAGPLAWARASSGELTVTWERFVRHGSAWRLGVTTPAPDEPDPLVVALERSFHHAVQVEQVVPEPSSVTVTPAEVVYAFDTARRGEDVEVVWVASRH